eukprot:TRINITY_DN6469_c0_g1_i1.p1 TRINITY_DN6469_c0_g1~~TRINITY_DN6469_c0_g1_i1.p1  ORF type:complete len:186 (+),score=51.84 TRINITY_DN6469_c0_g1_i1:126-683(+)
MKLSVILSFVLLVVLSNAQGHKYQNCKLLFERISKNPIFTAQNVDANLVKKEADSLIYWIYRIWEQECKEAISVLAQGGQKAAGLVYAANTELYNSFNIIRQNWAPDSKPQPVIFGIWAKYVDRIRLAAAALNENSVNQYCQNSVKSLKSEYKNIKSNYDVLSVIWRTFDNMAFCEWNKDRVAPL